MYFLPILALSIAATASEPTPEIPPAPDSAAVHSNETGGSNETDGSVGTVLDVEPVSDGEPVVAVDTAPDLDAVPDSGAVSDLDIVPKVDIAPIDRGDAQVDSSETETGIQSTDGVAPFEPQQSADGTKPLEENGIFVEGPSPAQASAGGPALGDDFDLDFDFDFLGDPEPTSPPVDASLLARRRLMLKGHQAMGLALVALMAGTMISGQLNYWDGHMADETARFKLSHRVLSYSTLGAFALTGGAALFAPVPPDRTPSGLDRVMLHRIGLFGAAAGMVAQAVLGPITASRQGFNDQDQFAMAHLAVGWTTLAFMAFGVGAIVF